MEVLLVEDNPGDVVLIKEGFREGKFDNTIHTAEDGVEAMAFLRKEGQHTDKPRPDLVLLDINLPRKNGHEVLQEIKNDSDLKMLPVVMLTTSDRMEDIRKSYASHVNAYMTKPVNLGDLMEAVKAIESFWFEFVKLPPK